jgi:hypothetical protein
MHASSPRLPHAEHGAANVYFAHRWRSPRTGAPAFTGPLQRSAAWTFQARPTARLANRPASRAGSNPTSIEEAGIYVKDSFDFEGSQFLGFLGLTGTLRLIMTTSANGEPEPARRLLGYVETQEERHRSRIFPEEYREFLRKHDLEYDESYVWIEATPR